MELIDKQKHDGVVTEYLDDTQLDEIVKRYVTVPADDADRELKMMVLSLVSDLRNARGDLHSTQEEIDEKQRSIQSLSEQFSQMIDERNAALEANKLLEAERDKLNSWIKNAEAKENHYDELRRMFNAMEERALQAEQERDELQRQNTNLRHAESNAVQQYGTLRKERDEAQWKSLWYEAHVEDAGRSARYWQGHYYEIVQERNALMGGLKWYADRNRYVSKPTDEDFTEWDAPEANEDGGERARSIIAKIEGSKPEWN